MAMRNSQSFDALLPAEIAARAEAVGVAKATQDAVTTFTLAVLAGAFIALGAVFSTTVSAGAGSVVPFGIVRLLAGLVFSLGLILVIVGGAELFTGNTLIVMAWASGRLSASRLLRNWSIVFAGNVCGAVATAVIVHLGRQYSFGHGAVGAAALSIGLAKVQLGFAQAIALGMLGNALVCLAVWLSLSARGTGERILAVVFPIAAFVAAGFEHSVANVYFVPSAMAIRDLAPPEFWVGIAQRPEQYDALTWSAFLVRNLVPVTLGNVIGGAGMVGAVYWFVYLRPRSAVRGAAADAPRARRSRTASIATGESTVGTARVPPSSHS